MISDYFKLSFKNLKHRGIRSWLTLLGIFIGIMAVVSLISLGGALKAGVMSQFGVSNTEVITVQAGGLSGYGPPGSGAVNPLTEENVDEINKLSSVEIAVARQIPSGKAEFNDRVVFGFAASIPEGDKRKFVYEESEIKAEQGRLLQDGDDNKVMLGHNFYTDKVGFEKAVVPGNSILIQDKKFLVVGIVEKQGSFIMDNVIFMNEEPLDELFNITDNSVDMILVKVKDKDLMDRAKQEIEKYLRRDRNVKEGEEDFEVSTPESSLATVNSILSGVQAFIVIIACISILVGALGIVNTMTTSVLERERDIGIMKAIGAKNSDIFYQFFIEAGLMGLIGGLLGTIFGLLIGFAGTMGINNLLGADVPMQVNILFIVMVLTTSFLIGSIAGITPALNAAKKNPVEALRK